MKQKPTCAVLILAGGRSERMGFPKPFLKAGSMSFLERIVYTYYASGYQDIHVVMNHRLLSPHWRRQRESFQGRVNLIPNPHPEKGRLYSLQLASVLPKAYDFIFIQNADSPLIYSDTLDRLWKFRMEEGMTVPVFEGRRGHPILLSAPVMKKIYRPFPAGSTLRQVLSDQPVREVAVGDPGILVNINSPEDLRQYFPQTQIA